MNLSLYRGAMHSIRSGNRRWNVRLLVCFTALFVLLSFFTVHHHLTCSVDQLFASPFNDEDLRSLDRTLRVVTDVFDRLNVTYFMTSGTLLGSYRHHGLIPWDDDVDLMLRASDKTVIFKALTALSPDYGLYLSGPMDSPYHWKFYPRRHGRFMLLRPFRWPFVDLLFYQDNGTHIWNENPFFPREVWIRRSVFPLHRRPFGDLMLPAPCDSAAHLAVMLDPTVCVSRSWNHVIDLPMLPGSAVSVPCSSLTNWPLVERSERTVNETSKLVSETLTVGESKVKTIQLVQLISC